MKKKIIAVLVLALLVSTVSVFALGIGIQGGGVYTLDTKGFNFNGNLALTLKVDQSPLVFAADFYLNKDLIVFGFNTDQHINIHDFQNDSIVLSVSKAYAEPASFNISGASLLIPISRLSTPG